MIEKYQTIKIENKITFSGSNLNNFFFNPKLFWDRVFGRDLFIETTNTVLGTVIHYCANQYLTTKQVSSQDIENYLQIVDSSVDRDFIRNHYKDMGNKLFEWLDSRVFGEFKSEIPLKAEVSKYGVLTGTCDLVIRDTLVDFKTTSQLSDNTKIPMNYIKQLQAYYYLCHKNDIVINQAKIVYITIPRIGEISEKTGKLLRDYPCRIYELPLEREFLDILKIENYLKAIGEQIDFIKENPDKAHLITREGVEL